MTPSPENETCEETSKQMWERVNQTSRAWKGVKVNQRTGGGAEQVSGEGSRQG